MQSAHRKYSLGIWALGLGYFTFYLPYSALTKLITTGRLPGMNAPVSGFELLPLTVVATPVAMFAFITAAGWWKYAGRRRIFGRAIPFPSRWTILSGTAFAIIIGTTTLAYTFAGVSILFALLLMRGGVLIMSPIVDAVFKRHVRWFSWAALSISLVAVGVAFADVSGYQMTAAAALNLAAYLCGYMMRLPCITRAAKCPDKDATRGYFVGEQMVAMPLLVAIPAAFALIGKGAVMMDLRHGFTTFWDSGIGIVGPALMIGLLYAGLGTFGTLIYLDRRENTFCIPLNRCSSLLSGIAGTYVLAAVFGMKTASVPQLISGGMIVTALLLLSPLHHAKERLAQAFAERRLKWLIFVAEALRKLADAASTRAHEATIEQRGAARDSDM